MSDSASRLVVGDIETASRAAATLIVDLLDASPGALLCAATGASPTPAYRHLTEEVLERPSLHSRLRVIALDEWGGLAAGDPATCDAYLREHVARPLSLAPERYVSFRSDAPEPVAECARVASWLAENGPIDVAVVGVGTNGHVALNEPGTPPESTCHVAELAATSLAHPMLSVSQARPPYGLTLGLADILASRHLVFLAFGRSKAGPVARLVSGPESLDHPVTWLRRHSGLAVFVDPDALSQSAPGGVLDFATRSPRAFPPRSRT